MCGVMISIHAPREGGDNESRIRPCVNENFNPGPPRGGRPLIDGQQRQRLPISIHAPREGGDEDVYAQIMAKLNISIHAPREGGDVARRRLDVLLLISIHAPREGGDFCQSKTV